MKMVICKNCGGSFNDEADRCPYCGTMHKKGAYAKFRRKVSDVIDRLLGLKVEAERSVSRIILSSILRALVLCAVCIGHGIRKSYKVFFIAEHVLSHAAVTLPAVSRAEFACAGNHESLAALVANAAA